MTYCIGRFLCSDEFKINFIYEVKYITEPLHTGWILLININHVSIHYFYNASTTVSLFKDGILSAFEYQCSLPFTGLILIPLVKTYYMYKYITEYYQV
jgi:hypothetical protein